MTNMPEAKLAREAELCYATLALATDYDVWHDTHAAVSVEAVVANLLKNVATAKQVLRTIIPTIGGTRACECPRLLESAVITNSSAFPHATRRRLDLLIGKYFPEGRSRVAPKSGHPRRKPGSRTPLQ
jgi:5'-methylthioadenosine phosphorylase